MKISDEQRWAIGRIALQASANPDLGITYEACGKAALAACAEILLAEPTDEEALEFLSKNWEKALVEFVRRRREAVKP